MDREMQQHRRWETSRGRSCIEAPVDEAGENSYRSRSIPNTNRQYHREETVSKMFSCYTSVSYYLMKTMHDLQCHMTNAVLCGMMIEMGHI